MSRSWDLGVSRGTDGSNPVSSSGGCFYAFDVPTDNRIVAVATAAPRGLLWVTSFCR